MNEEQSADHKNNASKALIALIVLLVFFMIIARFSMQFNPDKMIYNGNNYQQAATINKYANTQADINIPNDNRYKDYVKGMIGLHLLLGIFLGCILGMIIVKLNIKNIFSTNNEIIKNTATTTLAYSTEQQQKSTFNSTTGNNNFSQDPQVYANTVKTTNEQAQVHKDCLEDIALLSKKVKADLANNALSIMRSCNILMTTANNIQEHRKNQLTVNASIEQVSEIRSNIEDIARQLKYISSCVLIEATRDCSKSTELTLVSENLLRLSDKCIDTTIKIDRSASGGALALKSQNLLIMNMNTDVKKIIDILSKTNTRLGNTINNAEQMKKTCQIFEKISLPNDEAIFKAMDNHDENKVKPTFSAFEVKNFSKTNEQTKQINVPNPNGKIRTTTHSINAATKIKLSTSGI